MREIIKKIYDIAHTTTARPLNQKFELHSHENYEIFLFIEGDAKFIVEENIYTLEPYDIIVIRKNQMHRLFLNSSVRYQRIVLRVHPNFFEKYGCTQYEDVFFNTLLGNKISADFVIAKKIYEAFMRLEKYTKRFREDDSPIARAIITEILYLLNSAENYTRPDAANRSIGKVISYLNESFTENIRLDELEQKFFISRHHICRSFKKVTSLTIHQYITQKRMTYIKELIKKGNNIGEAASLAGYSSYESFYRAFTKEYGKSPKALLNTDE